MTPTQWASLAEIAASLAVVVSLIYLAMQVRQSNVVARAQMRQSMIVERTPLTAYYDEFRAWD